MPPMARPSFREKKRALVAKWKFMVACTVCEVRVVHAAKTDISSLQFDLRANQNSGVKHFPFELDP